MEEFNALGNVKISDDHVICTINPKIYPLDTVYSAAYIMIDNAYILLAGDPDAEIRVEIRQKRKPFVALKDLAIEFNEQLLNYSVYKVQSEKNKILREIMMQRVMLTNAPAEVVKQVRGEEEKRRQEIHKKLLENEKHGTEDNPEQKILSPDRH